MYEASIAEYARSASMLRQTAMRFAGEMSLSALHLAARPLGGVSTKNGLKKDERVHRADSLPEAVMMVGLSMEDDPGPAKAGSIARLLKRRQDIIDGLNNQTSPALEIIRQTSGVMQFLGLPSDKIHALVETEQVHEAAFKPHEGPSYPKA